MDGQYVIQDPYHDYAIRFMYQMHRNYGWKAVCFYTNTADLRRSFRSYPELRDPEMVAASYRSPTEVCPGSSTICAQRTMCGR